ncbi:MAG: SdrD B-like domain-containing protein [Candidatus Andersenbacteria bacterium]
MQRSFPRGRGLGVARSIAASALALVASGSFALLSQPSYASFATADFTTSSGGALAGYAIGDDLFVTITDANRNTDASSKQSVELTVSSTTAGDAEPMTVTNGRAAVETGNDTGVFRNTTGYKTRLKQSTVTVNDGVLDVNVTDTITVSYTDASGETDTFDFSNSPLPHVGYEGGHIDDGSAADDPTQASCADTAVYAGAEGAINFNDPANGGYIPTDRTKWDVQPGSKAGVNDGPTTSNISSDNTTYESNKSTTASVTNPTGCHGWNLHEFDFNVSPFSASSLTSLDPFWRGMATRNVDGGESAALNDLFMLAYNRTANQWTKLDTEANIATSDISGPPYTNLTLSSSITASIGDYVNSSGVVRLLVAEYSATPDNVTLGGGLYTDYVRLNATGTDVATDTITVSGGSIFGTVWNDKDRDATFDSSEPGLAGVTVTLLDSGGNTLVSDTTDSNGDYGFIGFPAATYNLRETDPAGFLSTTPNDLGPLTLTAGQTISDENFGDAQQLPTTGLTTGYTVGTFVAVYALGLGLLFGAPRLRRIVRSNRSR